MPPKKQKKYYSGKKKKHTVKVQITADEKSKNIVSIAFSKGKTHDFRLFKDNCRNIREDIWVIADKGYCGIFNIHFRSLIPVKTSRNHRLTDTDRAFNSALSRHRIFIEHVNRYIKRFRILSSRYRNRHRRLFLRVNLICSIYNLQHCI